MATGIKGICNASQQLNDVQRLRHSHIRKFCDGTRHFTRLSSKIFDNVIYESIYGVSLPAMSTDDIMGGTGKRYSSIISDSEKDVKCCNPVRDDDEGKRDEPEVGVESKVDEPIIKEPPEVHKKDINTVPDTSSDNQLDNPKNESDSPSTDGTPVTASPTKVNPEVETNQDKTSCVTETSTKDDDESNKNITNNGSTTVSQPSGDENTRPRSDSHGIGRTPRNSNQVDITSDPLYKEIYANNLRQYGFLLAKKLGISNQSPRELRATYLQNRQKAEQRRERTSASFSEFSKRLSKPSNSEDERRVSTTNVVTVPNTNGNEENEPKEATSRPRIMQRSNTIGGTTTSTTTKEFPVRNRMQRSNTIEYIDRTRDKFLGSIHSRSISDLTNKYSDSLTNINEVVQEKDSSKPYITRRMKKLSDSGLHRHNISPPLSKSPSLNNSSDSIDKKEPTNYPTTTDICHQRLHSGSFNDKEPSKKQPTTVLRRKHKNIRDPHKRLSVPLFTSNNTPNIVNGCYSPPRLDRRLSLPLYANSDSVNSMTSLSVPDLYHNSSFGKEQLMDTYCKQEVPRKKLSVESLRRHSEAKERLEWRMSKLKSFEGILSEADSFMKDRRTKKTSSGTSTPPTIDEESTTVSETICTVKDAKSTVDESVSTVTETKTTEGESAVTTREESSSIN